MSKLVVIIRNFVHADRELKISNPIIACDFQLFLSHSPTLMIIICIHINTYSKVY